MDRVLWCGGRVQGVQRLLLPEQGGQEEEAEGREAAVAEGRMIEQEEDDGTTTEEEEGEEEERPGRRAEEDEAAAGGGGAAELSRREREGQAPRDAARGAMVVGEGGGANPQTPDQAARRHPPPPPPAVVMPPPARGPPTRTTTTGEQPRGRRAGAERGAGSDGVYVCVVGREWWCAAASCGGGGAGQAGWGGRRRGGGREGRATPPGEYCSPCSPLLSLTWPLPPSLPPSSMQVDTSSGGATDVTGYLLYRRAMRAWSEALQPMATGLLSPAPRRPASLTRNASMMQRLMAGEAGGLYAYAGAALAGSALAVQVRHSTPLAPPSLLSGGGSTATCCRLLPLGGLLPRLPPRAEDCWSDGGDPQHPRGPHRLARRRRLPGTTYPPPCSPPCRCVCTLPLSAVLILALCLCVHRRAVVWRPARPAAADEPTGRCWCRAPSWCCCWPLPFCGGGTSSGPCSPGCSRGWRAEGGRLASLPCSDDAAGEEKEETGRAKRVSRSRGVHRYITAPFFLWRGPGCWLFEEDSSRNSGHFLQWRSSIARHLDR